MPVRISCRKSSRHIHISDLSFSTDNDGDASSVSVADLSKLCCDVSNAVSELSFIPEKISSKIACSSSTDDASSVSVADLSRLCCDVFNAVSELLFIPENISSKIVCSSSTARAISSV